jgi:hypothetical protein
MTSYCVRGSHDTISVHSNICVKVTWGPCDIDEQRKLWLFLTSTIMSQAQRERKRDKFLKFFRPGSSRATSPAPPIGTIRTEQDRLHTNPSQEVHLQSKSQPGTPSPWKIAADGAQLVLSSLDRCLDGVPIASNVVGAINVLVEIANVGSLTIIAVILHIEFLIDGER